MVLRFFIFFALLTNYAIGQTNPSVVREAYTTSCPSKPIFIKGRVTEYSNKESLPHATVFIKGTKIFCTSDSLGLYSLDISAISDSAIDITIICHYIGHKQKEEPIKGKVKNTMEINFEMETLPTCNYPEVDVRKKGKQKK